MIRNEYVIVYQPFETSDMTLEALAFGKDDEEALKEFKMLHPQQYVKSVTKK